MSRVVVIGSINVDIVATSARIPRPGETVFGDAVALHPGGKGANQAVAARRLGVPVLLSGALGTDQFSAVPHDFLSKEGIDLSYVASEVGPTGTALIIVDGTGENAIVVVPGANHLVWAQREPHLGLHKSDVVLLQNEIPEETNLAALRQAQTAGARCVLNLAPYRATSLEVLSSIDYLIVNETEFAGLLSIDAADMSPERVMGLLANGAGPTPNTVVTLGEGGLVVRLDGSVSNIEGHQVPVADTTGAGDSFCGAFGAGLVQGLEPIAALQLANRAAALSVQRQGAGPSMPTAEEVAAFLPG